MTAPAARVFRPLRAFLATESAGGVVLVAVTLLALVWANSPWQSSYTDWWSRELTIGLGSHAVTMDLQHWVNDGLMTLFFFVVGLEIKRELVTGELRDPRAAVAARDCRGWRDGRPRGVVPQPQSHRWG